MSNFLDKAINEYSTLSSALQVYFGNSYRYAPNIHLQYLVALTLFYSDEDLTADLKNSLNKLMAILVKIDLLKMVGSQTEIPTKFTCTIDARPEAKPNTFAFSPVITLPESKDLSHLKNDIDAVYDELKNINIAGLGEYVKNKAEHS